MDQNRFTEVGFTLLPEGKKKKKRQNIFKNSLKVLSIRQWKAEIPENRKTNKAIPIVAQLSVWRKILDCNTRKGTAC